jgi:FixJ family two-component response regulator
MKAGAVDFLTKPVNDAELIDTIGRAVEEDRLARGQRAELSGFHERLATLTPREREVMAQVVSGKLNKQVAAELGTAEKTVKVHRARVMEKLRVGSLAELVRLCERTGASAFGGD